MKIPRLPDDEQKDAIRLKWEAFHRENPHVYTALVRLARRRVLATGATRLGIGQLFEVLRYETAIQTRSEDGFKLNNNHRPLYAREIMRRERDLDGIFETRYRTAGHEE